MYPNLYYAFKDLFGVEWHFLSFFNTFGVFVAISFLLSAWLLEKELRRKSAEGLIGYEEEKILIGGPVSTLALLTRFLFGFILGYKLLGAFLTEAGNQQNYIKSLAGSWPGGIIIGLLLAGQRWVEARKERLGKPEEKTIRIWPYERVTDIAVLAGIFGFVGAKIFNSLENWDDFLRSPTGSLFSFSGLTFYGGLICAALAIWWFARKHHIPFWHLNDAAAPVLIFAYAIGRIGCQVSGDGDWGIPNTAYIATAEGKTIPDTTGQFPYTVQQNLAYYTYEFGSPDKIRHLSVKAPSYLPDWLYAYSYPHNVNDAGIDLAHCTGQHCSYLPAPVFPTPFYETIMGLLLFALLWRLRKKLTIPGTLFSIYLVLNGIERFMIEKIRVNTEYHILGFFPTQAELISSALIITGLVSYFILTRKAAASKKPGAPGSLTGQRESGQPESSSSQPD